jgi:ATP-binding cassette subfamily F protein 3
MPPLCSRVSAHDTSIARLVTYLESQSSKRVRRNIAATRLEKAVQMKSQKMSTTLAMTGPVELDSVNKGQASRVDLGKLAKAEAKIKAKIEKRERGKKADLYQGSKLIDAQKKQQSYEEMFMAVNPLDMSGNAKGKSKDIHLSNIDVNFGSNRIL